MSSLPAPFTADAWLAHVFSSKAVCEGAIIRRKLRDVERYVGRDRFEDELRRRGFQAIENAGQIVIFCNREPIRLVL